MRLAGLRELLRPPPHRGPLIAAGAVALAVGLALEEIRLEDKLANPVHMVILLVAGALIFWLGAQAPNEDGEPPAYQSILLVTGAALLYAGLLTAADVFGANFDDFPAGAFVWTSALTGALALWPAFERNSAISLLLAALLGGVALLSAWSWIFDAESAAPYRWLLAAYAAALVLCALALREPARRHAEVLIDAAGLAIAAIALVPAPGDLLFGDASLPGFWEVVLLGAGFGLVAFGALDRSPGPAYLGVVNLVLFIVVVAESGEQTLYWWPLTLIAVGVAMLAAGLRPRRPLPPEPAPYKAGEAPLAARADEDEIVYRVRDDS
jgi:peptidoglycan/LPS O-acetylase OafA/YrhL